MRIVVLSLLCFLLSALWLAVAGCDRLVPLGSVDLAAIVDGGTPTLDLLSPPTADLAATDLAVHIPSFDPAGSYDIGAAVASLASGDFDGDLRPDLVVASQAGNNITVLLGTGKGTFSMMPPLTVSAPSALAVGDLDGDGKPDLVVVTGGGAVNLYHGVGDGTFLAPVSYVVSLPGGVAIADLDGDGSPDLVVAGMTISVFLNGGNLMKGTVKPATYGKSGDLYGPVAIADLDGKQGRDVVAGSTLKSTSDGVTVLLNLGAGTFAPPQSYSAASRLSTVVLANLDGDTRPDVATVSLTVSTVDVLLGDGNGGLLLPAKTFATSTPASALVAGDFDHDGLQDLVTAVAQPFPGAALLLGKGDGTFRPAFDLHVATTADSTIATLDFDGDTRPDLAIATANLVTILHNITQ